jgi:hypothetical protein
MPVQVVRLGCVVASGIMEGFGGGMVSLIPDQSSSPSPEFIQESSGMVTVSHGPIVVVDGLFSGQKSIGVDSVRSLLPQSLIIDPEGGGSEPAAR